MEQIPLYVSRFITFVFLYLVSQEVYRGGLLDIHSKIDFIIIEILPTDY